MLRRITPIIFIFFSTLFFWWVLSGNVEFRSDTQDRKLKMAVGQLWGTAQHQQAPKMLWHYKEKVEVQRKDKDGRFITKIEERTFRKSISLSKSDIKVNLELNHRKKGLLWYATYRVNFSAAYVIENTSDKLRQMSVNFEFPNKNGVYDDFLLKMGQEKVADLKIEYGTLSHFFKLQPGEKETVEFSYTSQGMDEWWYGFGTNVTLVKDFSLKMQTNFSDIDFPQNSISPGKKEKTAKGWNLSWQYKNLLSGVQIGMSMPKKLNPGPWVSRVTFYAPVSLFLFFFLLFVLTTIRKIKIHPMNYFFLAASFFSFHLLLAYLVDHISVYLAIVLCSIVSLFLVISYMRLLVNARFAFLETGISQFVYLVLFSCTFFFEKYTGLAVTILCIVTLFIIMQITAKVDWEESFQENKSI
ncbi:inner membrane CreD family protein [Candidatus Riflebacteria bacterium]